MRTALGGLALLIVWSGAGLAQAPKTVILVRHAERPGGMTADEGISQAGRCRAEVLARMLTDSAVKRIFVSEVSRTLQTAEPLASKLGIKPDVTPAKDLDGLAKKLQALRAGETALVVGHSNTVPDIAKRLGATVPAIADTEFDRMFIVTVVGPKRAAVTALRYPGCGQ